MKKIYSIFIILFTITVNAQSPHQFSISAGGIFTKANYELSKGDSKTDNGFQVGIGYRYYLNENWSLGSGVEYQYFDSHIFSKNLSDKYQTQDMEGDAFEFRYSADDYRENQNAQYLSIPINVQFETSGETAWYANLGGKVGFNLSAEYETKIKQLNTSGYYEQWNVELFDPRFMGFGTWNEVNSGKKDLELKTLFMLTAETGVKQKVSEKSNIYIGLYLNYGLNDLKEESTNQNAIQYNVNQPNEFMFNSFLNSSESIGNPYSEKLNLMSFGVKLNWAWGG